MSRNGTNHRSSGWGGISLSISNENDLRPDMFRKGEGRRHESGNIEGVCDLLVMSAKEGSGGCGSGNLRHLLSRLRVGSSQ